jgi:hypothetical protein
MFEFNVWTTHSNFLASASGSLNHSTTSILPLLPDWIATSTVVLAPLGKRRVIAERTRMKPEPH